MDMEDNVFYIEQEQESLDQPDLLTSLWNAVKEMISPKVKLVLAALLLCLALDSVPELTAMHTSDPIDMELVATDYGNVRQDISNRLTELTTRPIATEDGVILVNQDVVDCARVIIAQAPSSDLVGWRLYPDAKGAIGWDYQEEGCVSSISMGSDGFSWFMQKGTQLDMKDNVALIPESIISCLHAVHSV